MAVPVEVLVRQLSAEFVAKTPMGPHCDRIFTNANKQNKKMLLVKKDLKTVDEYGLFLHIALQLQK